MPAAVTSCLNRERKGPLNGGCDDRGGSAQGIPAPRGAVLYRPRSGRRWEELSLDLMADLDLNGEGDNSMPGNRRLMPRRMGWRAGGAAAYGESWIALVPGSRRPIRAPPGKTP